MHTRSHFGQVPGDLDEIEANWLRDLAAEGAAANAALESFIDAYGRLVVKRLMRLGLLEADAHDVSQEIWIALMKAAPSWRGEAPTRVLVLRVLGTQVQRWWSRNKDLRKRESLSDEMIEAEAPVAPPLFGGVTAHTPEWQAFVRCVRAALARFELDHPRLAQLLQLVHLFGISHEEAAREMGGDAKLVKGQVFSARRKISPDIQPCLELWPNRRASKP